MFFLLHVVLLCLPVIQCQDSAGQVCVCSKDETVDTPCCEHANKTCFSSFLEDSILNESFVAICESEFTLTKKVIFENLKNVTLAGVNGGTNITCARHQDAGFQIVASRDIELTNIWLINCGTLQNSTSESVAQKSQRFLKFNCSLHIVNTTGLVIQNVNILSGKGTGLVMINSYGSVLGCIFRENQVDKDLTGIPGGGGMYVEINSEHQPFKNSSRTVAIRNCAFLHNEAVSLSRNRSYIRCNNKMNAFGRGGGLAILLVGHATDNTVEVSDVMLMGNKAIWGGGMYLHFCKQAVQNRVYVKNVTFDRNMCDFFGGGGIDIGFTLLDRRTATENSVKFENCTFQHNRAFVGGGVVLYSSETDTKLNNSAIFDNCTWQYNTAYYSSALDITPQLITTPTHGDQAQVTLKDVKVVGNTLRSYVSTSKEIDDREIEMRKRLGLGKGTFIITGQTILFEGTVDFINNTGSAIYTVSSILEFTNGTCAKFVNNSGLFGGAISLIGFSALKLNYNITVLMHNNSAALGAGIFHQSFDKHDYLFSHSCFLQSVSNNSKDSVFFEFQGNYITDHVRDSLGNYTSVHGRDMYVTTLLPCIEYCNYDSTNLPLFNCIGNFEFVDGKDTVATSGAYFWHNYSEPIHFIPGNWTEIPFLLCDDLDRRVHGIYHITTDDDIYIDDRQTYTSENTIVLKGKPGTHGNVTITKTPPRELSLSIEVILDECPPFFYYKSDDKICACAVQSSSRYKNIHLCDKSMFKSQILHGYWVGYENNDTSAENFRYGICPPTFCFDRMEYERYHELPHNSKVEGFVCGKTRSGILCGQCRSGYCAQYHSHNFRCGDCQKCENGVGWVLYIVSELLPLTFLFSVIMIFDISFTSGYLNGFILFSQIFDSVFSVGSGFVFFPPIVHKLSQTILVFYKLFNFDFFGNDHLSFCLWKDAKTIHLMSFKFLTVGFAAVLVVATVLLMKRCAYSKKLLCCTQSVSMIHGLSAFLVMVYTQCTNISFQLLNYVIVFDLHGKQSRQVLFYQGQTELFSQDHIPFAFMAVVCLSTLTLIPPLFLITYPLCYRIAAFLGVGDTKFSKLVGKLCPLSKLKPVFDSFQGCYKDKYRFFAGLYFVYRVGLLASVVTSNPMVTYALTQIQLSLMLAIHCICWPYVRRVHNIIDTLIFLNCSLINIITILNYVYGQDGSIYQSTINKLTYVQILLIYAPFAYFVAFTVYSIVKFYLSKRKKIAEIETEEDILMERLGSFSEELGASSNSYNKLVDTY